MNTPRTRFQATGRERKAHSCGKCKTGIGKSTTSEFAATVVGPKTKNPHDPLRTPGGSSSGSAAAVGDFQAPVALATQTGGSTIRPGSYNGIYAFKPTWNVISREGVKIYSVLFDTVSLYARCVDDLDLIADALNIRDDEPVADSFSVQGARFAVVKTMVWPEAGPGTVNALSAGVDLLRKNGADVEEIELPPELDGLPQWHGTWLAAEGRTSFLSEYRTAKGKLDESLVGHVENRLGLTRAAQTEAIDSIAAARPIVDEIAGRYAALLTPSVVDEAPTGTALTGSAAFNSIWTVGICICALHSPPVLVGLANMRRTRHCILRWLMCLAFGEPTECPSACRLWGRDTEIGISWPWPRQSAKSSRQKGAGAVHCEVMGVWKGGN